MSSRNLKKPNNSSTHVKKRIPTTTPQKQTNNKKVVDNTKKDVPVVITPHVDGNAIECTIHDLNQKLLHLRTHLALLNDTNLLLTNTLRCLELDRDEAISYYTRNIDERNQAVRQLEERLRQPQPDGDTGESQMLNLLEEQYKAIHGQLTCEIKMLSAKLHSLELFRLRRDQLLAKLESQQLELKASEDAHRHILYDVEQKMLCEKQALQQEVESKLQQLSNDFTRYSNSIPHDFANCLQHDAVALQRVEIANVLRPQSVLRNCRINRNNESNI